MPDFPPAFEEATLNYPGEFLHKFSFKIQFSEEYKSTVLHWHNFAQLWHVEEGTLMHRVGDVVYTQPPGTFIFIPPYTSHSIDSTKSEIAPRYGQISFTDNFLTDNGFDFFSHHPKFSHFKGRKIPGFIELEGKMKSVAYDIISELYHEFSRDRNRSFKKISVLLSELFDCITSGIESSGLRGFKYISERANAIMDAVNYIASNYSKKITLDMLCGITHMSRSFLTENFRDVTGRTAFEILLAARVCNALHSILYSDLTLTEIAENVGFVTKSRLSHEFSKRYGFPPMEYRRKFQREYLERDEKLATYWAQFDHID